MSVIDGIVGVGLLFLAFCDIRSKEIPILPVGLYGATLLVVRLWQGAEFMEIVPGLIPGAVALVLSVCSEGKVGIGDGLVLCALGMGYSLHPLLGVLGLALVFAATGAIVLIVLKKVGRNREMPFLPYLFAGYLLCVTVG